jgi:hypothetical protein
MHFEEKQRLNQLGFQIIYWLGSLPAFVIVGKEVAQDEMYDGIWMLLAIFLVFAAVYFFVFYTAAQSRIDSIGIHYRYWPFVPKTRTITWKEIKKVEVKTYSALSDYGGWGYKFGRRKRAIVLGGDYVIAITRQNDSVFAISTQKPEMARSALAHYAPENIA